MDPIIVDLSKYEHSFSLKNKLGRLIWNITYLLFFRPFSFRFFNPWRILILKTFGAKLSWNATVYASVQIWAPWNLTMGAYSSLGPYVDCYNQGKISIGSNTAISQKSYLCASSHDITDPKHNLILKPITIEDQVWVAADAFIGPGVKLRQGCVVGARSSVFQDVAPWTVVRGNPSVPIKNRVMRTNHPTTQAI